ncbi:NAD(P)-dependent alcohol dehydrogenase [Ilumatobacter nonamiensis]|uniref:NAD(P)-dependent alcohol dehydrogenase n=1 Tax=Ilumatobacter nonamiensis TaxID=467093 RepID=UPI0003471835|nr:NAD(P)-dependent alcohol dehydrogenase [Ilumatobacter nonamiensis]
MDTTTNHTTTPETASATDKRATSMTAVVRHRYGGPESIELDRLDVPTPKSGQVVVEVAASAIDRGVVHLMTGLPLLIRIAGFGLFRPKQPVLGSDVAGRVVAVGADGGRFQVGDEVMGVADGAFAEYAVADVDKLVLRPSNVSVEDAAVSTISGITALQALTAVGRVTPGQRVLVIGASGGVGSFAVQIATALGAQVTGVASAKNLDNVRTLGAVHAVDHGMTPIDEIGSTFDLIIDIAGRNPLRRLRRALAPTGTLVIVGGEDGGTITGGTGRNVRAILLSMFSRQRLTAFISKESTEFIEPLAEMLADGSIAPLVGARTDLAGVADAIATFDQHGVAGKTLVRLEGA